ncbi:MAG TPA: VOC family protein [Gemmatimonadaceae bacterium]|nr:VOC family protein [Gemmatimonadaceae bacterium]
MSDNVSNGIAPSGFRLPAETYIGLVRLQISDLARSLAYYERVLGMRTLSRAAGVAQLGAVEGDTPILELHEKKGVNPIPRRGRLGLFHFAILLPDRASLGRFVTHLSDIGAYAGMSDHIVSEALYLSDPDGLGIEVYADRPRGGWRYKDRELVMGTLPLDVPDLVSAGGATRWTGMPNGTRMGHVHLYVGDLDEGAAFYHEALGFDKVVWGYPGALFLSAGGYHHHLGTNTWAAGAPPATDDDARLLEWELVLPSGATVADAAASVEGAGGQVERLPNGEARARDPWGTAVRLVPAR